MISGALLLGNQKNADIQYVYKVRIKNIVIPFVTWSAIYLIIQCVLHDENFIRELAKSTLRPRAYSYHLWYLYMLILLYAVTPLIMPLICAGNKYIDYFLIFWLIFSVCYPLTHHVYPGIELKIFQNYNIAGGYLGYYILGYRLSRCELRGKKRWLIMFICGWIITCICFVSFQSYKQVYDDYFFGFLSPNIVCMSVAIFLLIKNVVGKQRTPNILKKPIKKLSYLSFGVYFIHFMIRDFVKIFLEKGYINKYLYLIVSPLVVSILSILIIYVVSKIKILRLAVAGISNEKERKS